MNRLVLFAALFGILFLSGCTLLGEEQCGTERTYVCGEDGNTYTNACYARQAGVRVAYEGQCTQNVTGAQCTDSDEGKNALEAGAVSVGTQVYNDSCADAASVYEYYCVDNAVQSESVICPTGTECREGECASYLCADTDGGRVQDVLGTARKGPDNRTDGCVDLGTVNEYYCLGNDIANIELACGSGKSCLNGACAQLACIDSDGGYNIYVKGTLREGSNVYADYCSGTSSVKEYYCSGDNVVPVTASCGDGFYCSEGACAEYTCRDTDGGRDEDEYGETSKGSDESSDECYDGDTVTEYFCSDNEIDSDRMDCGSGEVCSGGECVAEPCSDSDGGRVADVRGTVTRGSESRTDECYDSTSVKEYYCSGNNIASIMLTCTGGKVCSGGQCVAEPCSDSDGGNVRGIFGTVTIGSNRYPDSCIDLYNLKEYFCSGSTYGFEDILCTRYSEFCWNNVCSPAYCSDSDGGRDKNVYGTARLWTENGYSYSRSDGCSADGLSVIEQYCSDLEISTQTMACDLGQVCSGGRCVEATCTDSDGGRIYTVPGVAAKGSFTAADACESATRLVEYYCYLNAIAAETVTCPVGCRENADGVGYCNPL